MAPSLNFTEDQINAIRICTRTMSVLSLLGSCYIISTFICFPIYRKLINRLVFYATWGNIMANVATLISTSGIPKDPSQLSPLCEFQGVLIQWFLMADSLWVFCMATNVFLVFWHGHNAQELYYLEKWYFLFAYGLPAIPPMIFVIVDHHSTTRIIGSANLWCWIAPSVAWMRLAFFYGPVWLVIIATLTMYIATGIRIYKKGAGMRFFMSDSQHTTDHRESTVIDESAMDSVAVGKSIVVTTQIQYDIQQHEQDPQSESCEADNLSVSSYSSTKNLSRVGPRTETEHSTPDDLRVSFIARDAIRPTQDRKNAHLQADSGYKATAFATNQFQDFATLPARPTSAITHHRDAHPRKAVLNDAALAYLKVAFLMFVALFVVWVPSTVNRLYQFVHQTKPSFVLNLISATVLPLQGAWNATIYIYTTRNESRRIYASTIARLTGKPRPVPHHFQDPYRKNILTSPQGTQDHEDDIQLESGPRQGTDLRHNKLSQ